MANARKTALTALVKIDVEQAYSNIALNNAIKNSQLNAIDSSFCSALVYGVLERKITIDYIISQYSKIQINKINKTVLNILRLGIYQIIFMDKVPNSAAVNESVKLARLKKQDNATGFINGILRNLTRAKNPIKLPDKSNMLQHLSIKYSFPESIINLWIKEYGQEITLDILKSIEGRPPIAIRVNTTLCTKEKLMNRLTDKDIEIEEVPFLEDALWVSHTGSIEDLEEFKRGLFFVQDTASQLLCKIANPKKNQVVTDVCAAPGGKTFNLSVLLNNTGKIYSYDLFDHKIELIRKTAKRLKLKNIECKVRDAQKSKNGEKSNVVLCDVPCSGLGIIRRKPEIRYKEDLGVDTLPKIQYEILCNSKHLVAKGGILIYSTCTLNRAENNDIAKKFLAQNKDFIKQKISLPKEIKRTIKEEDNEITLFPFENNTDGFYISVFKKV